eukprot:6180603-Pleurochrysis_carterae.AAC.1
MWIAHRNFIHARALAAYGHRRVARLSFSSARRRTHPLVRSSVCFRLDTTYAFESPLPTSPVFPPVAAATPSAAQPAGPVTRSVARIASALLSSQPPSVSAPPRSLTDAESAKFVVSPEYIDKVDRQLMESILSTIDSVTACIPYRTRCNGSGRELIRILIAKSDAASIVVTPAIEAKMRALETKGVHEPSLCAFQRVAPGL